MLFIYKATDEKGKEVQEVTIRAKAWVEALCEHFGLAAIYRDHSSWRLHVRKELPLPPFGHVEGLRRTEGTVVVRVRDDDAGVTQEWLDWLSREPKPHIWKMWQGVAPDCIFWWTRSQMHRFDLTGAVSVSSEQALAELQAACVKHAGTSMERYARDTYHHLLAAVQVDESRTYARKLSVAKAALNTAPRHIQEQVFRLLEV